MKSTTTNGAKKKKDRSLPAIQHLHLALVSINVLIRPAHRLVLRSGAVRRTRLTTRSPLLGYAKSHRHLEHVLPERDETIQCTGGQGPSPHATLARAGLRYRELGIGLGLAEVYLIVGRSDDPIILDLED